MVARFGFGFGFLFALALIVLLNAVSAIRAYQMFAWCADCTGYVGVPFVYYRQGGIVHERTIMWGHLRDSVIASLAIAFIAGLISRRMLKP